MIQINLLPVQTKKKRETVRQFLSIYLAGIFLTAGGMGYLWYSKANKIESLTAQESQLQVEVKKYLKFEQMLKDLTKRKELVNKKRSVIDGLQKDRDTIVRMLALLSVELPADKMWFERFSQSAGTITLDGLALSNEAIAEFMRNLQSSPYVIKGSVNLTHSRQTLISNMKLREFQISYQFIPYSQLKTQPQPETQKP
jgi:type IV pilus assembly protein PilN